MKMSHSSRLYPVVGKVLIFLLFLLGARFANAQQRLEGRVYDAVSNQALPFVNISIVGTVHGTLSNKLGGFILPLPQSGQVKFSCMGYSDVTIDLDTINCSQLFTVKMNAKVMNLNSVEIKADFSFDKYIYKQVIKHKRENQDKVTSVGNYQVTKETLMLLAVEDSTSLGEYAKASLISNKKRGELFLPVYKSTAVHKLTVEGNRKNSKEVSRETEGIFDMLNQQLEELVLQKLSSDFDFYRNQITIFDHGFISPLSNTAFLHYNIYLSDSLRQDEDVLYKFDFYPKDRNACLFQGSLWVDSKTYALERITTTLPKTAGVNYVKSMDIEVRYTNVGNTDCFYKEQKVRTLLSLVKPAENKETRIGEASTGVEESSMLTNNNVLVHERTYFALPTIDGHYISVDSDSPHKTGVDTMLQLVTAGITTMRESPRLRLTDVVIGTCLTGYYDAGIIDIGPIQDLYTTNFVEGSRVTLPVRTNENLSEKYCIGTYVGIGTQSKELKYGAYFNYLLPTERRGVLTLSYDNDYMSASHDQFLTFVKDNAYSKGNGNLLSAITASERNPYMLDEQKMTLEWVRDLSDGIEMTVVPYLSTTQTTTHLPLIHEGISYSEYDNYGAILNMRFSFGQKAEDYFFQRFYYNNTKPVINLSLDLGKAVVDDQSSGIGYFHAHAALKNRFALGRYNFRVLINGGYIGGHVPYTMLQKPTGTYSLGYARYSYNLLHFASFAHNIYTNTYVSCNFGGIVLSHIPLIKKLHLREVASFKCYYGGLTKQYKGLFDIPAEFQNEMTKPYMEVGVGVGNIFKVLRIEYVHLIDNKQAIDNYAMKHGVRMKLELEF